MSLQILDQLLREDLDFHDKESNSLSHNIHAFPAKFPPQLPGKFIEGLTAESDIVLDPMAGSGTTILECLARNRNAIGFDIDPLAVRIVQSKINKLDPRKIRALSDQIVLNSRAAIKNGRHELEFRLLNLWDKKTQEFVDYWFDGENQLELLVISESIDLVEDEVYRRFFELIFSSIIVTKSGGVSLAFDLAHTRPHRAKVAYSKSGKLVVGEDLKDSTEDRVVFLTKKLKSPISEFSSKVSSAIKNFQDFPSREKTFADISYGDAQILPIANSSIDLIVTSPPYASNAIDYMRAHKFSLVWLGFDIQTLGELRKEYIGGEATSNIEYTKLPPLCLEVVEELKQVDDRKALVLHRYYSEMTRVIEEMYRVLKPGKCSIVVVGNSIIRNIDTRTAECLKEIGEALGFQVPRIGVRNLDRNRRMMPVSHQKNNGSQIQQRMHEEYVIGFYKPIL